MSTDVREGAPRPFPAASAEPAGRGDRADVGPRPGATAGSRRAAARMAARDLRRHPWRTLLILLLVGLPVFALSFGSILMASTALPTDAEQHQRQLWGFDGYLTEDDGWGGEGLQSPTEPGFRLDAEEAAEGVYGPAVDVTALDEAARDWSVCPATECTLEQALPAGTEATHVTTATTELEVPGTTVSVQVVVADVGLEQLQGPGHRFQLLDGALPGAGQALVSPGLVRELEAAGRRAESRGLEPGPTDRLDLQLPGGDTAELTVSGTQLDRNEQWVSAVELFMPLQDESSTVFLPAGSEVAEAFAAEGQDTAYLTGDVPDEYAAYRAYNQAGFTVLFAPVMADPGPIGEAFGAVWSSDAAWMVFIPLVFIGVLALAETGLLAGAAFAVGARQQRRATALLSVTGAEPSTLRQTMMFAGLWCGLAGALGGALLGVGAGLGVVGAAEARHVAVYGPHVPWWIVGLAAVLGLACAVVAAWIPARAVARQDAWGAIKGASGERRPVSRGVLVAGLVLVALGAVLSVAATLYGMSLPTLGELYEATTWLPVLLVGSALMLLVGVLLLVPGIVAGVAHLAGRLPVALRIAARDAHRNRSRTVPVAAAVVAATAVGAAVLTSMALGEYASSGTAGGSYFRHGSPTPDTGYLGVQDPAEVERWLAREAFYDPDGEVPTADEMGLYTGGVSGAVVELRQLAGVPGAPQVVEHWEMSVPQPSCEIGMSADCFELAPLYPESSACHVPIPAGATLEAREEALMASKLEMSRADGIACGVDAWSTGGAPFPDALSNLLVVDPLRPETLPTPLLGRDGELVEAVQSGRAVVFDEEYVDEAGRLTLGEFTMDVDRVPGLSLGERDREWLDEMATRDDPMAGIMGFSAFNGSNPMWEPERSVTLDAVVAPELEGDEPIAVIPVSALTGMDHRMVLDGMLARFDDPLTGDQLTLTNDILSAENLWMSGLADTGGYRDSVLWLVAGLMALLVTTVAGMTTGLALADARRDQAVLSSIGANPGTRRSMAAAQTFTGALTGTVLGVPVGAVAVIGIGALTYFSGEWIPWVQLLVVVLGVPVLAAALTWLVVPGRLPVREADRD